MRASALSTAKKEGAMASLSQEPETVKFVLQNGVGLHSTDAEPNLLDPVWQQRQMMEFIDIAVEAEELGFDGVSSVEHHALSVTAPSPHLLLAAAAMRTSRIRLATAVTVLPLYSPIRVAEEAGVLDQLSDGRFELGIGRGTGEVERVSGGAIGPEESMARWVEGIELLDLALKGREFAFDGTFTRVQHPFIVPTQPLQEPLPVWMGARSLESVERAAERGWNVFRNVGTEEEHRTALEHYITVGRDHGYQLSGANFMIERFIFISETEDAARRNFERTAINFARFRQHLSAGGRFTLPPSTISARSEGTPTAGPPPDAVVTGTPDQVCAALRQTLANTGARRLMVETFSGEEMRLFAREVMPQLRQADAFADTF
jgi:alkanesulfonate monooxygenase SsuD/methylene tetrahydromethanopterin reductase-like flavin-dependent oxidoreductase (luciferase family)